VFSLSILNRPTAHFWSPPTHWSTTAHIHVGWQLPVSLHRACAILPDMLNCGFAGPCSHGDGTVLTTWGAGQKSRLRFSWFWYTAKSFSRIHVELLKRPVLRLEKLPGDGKTFFLRLRAFIRQSSLFALQAYILVFAAPPTCTDTVANTLSVLHKRDGEFLWCPGAIASEWDVCMLRKYYSCPNPGVL